MGFHTNSFAEHSGLQYDKRSQNFWGTKNSFPIFVRYVPNRGSLVFILYGKLAASQQDGTGAENSEESIRNITRQLEEWQISQTGISGLHFRGTAVSCVIALSSRDTELNAINQVESLVHLAHTLGLVPCCMSCGAEFGYEPYILDETGVSLCPSCYAQSLGKISQVQEEHEQVRINRFGAAAGLLLGCALLFVLTYAVLRAGYVSYLTGYVGALVALLLMKKFGRRLTLPMAVIAVIVTMLFAVATPIVSFGKDLADFNVSQQVTAQKYVTSYEELSGKIDTMSDELKEMLSENMDIDLGKMKEQYEKCKIILSHQTTGSCIRDMAQLVKIDIYSSVKGELIKCILWGVISILIGSALTIPKLLQESSGKHTLRRPEAVI